MDVFFDNLQITHEPGPLLETNEYYPFGLLMKNISYRSQRGANYAENKYKFNAGTELNEALDIQYYETPLRNYDPQIGRFNCIDVLAEQYFALTPYQFAGNNPVSFNDPTGAKFTQNEPIKNPASFKNVRDLLKYIEEFGINDFGDNFNRWVFGAEGETVSFASGNDFSISSNGQFVTFSWTAEIVNGTASTWKEASGSAEGSESKTLNTLVLGYTTMQVKDYWGYALSWGESNRDVTYSWFGGDQHYDVMWDHNYALYKDRMYRGVFAQSSGDRASYDEQLPAMKAQYQREQSAKRTERMMYAGFGAAVAAPFAVYGALESGAVGVVGTVSSTLVNNIGSLAFRSYASIFTHANNLRYTIGTGVALYFQKSDLRIWSSLTNWANGSWGFFIPSGKQITEWYNRVNDIKDIYEHFDAP
ncbi:MAG TPA: RHS repeat-associated core domain-containing protein [Ferruginibacter sp.]|nr:RHS repeat-associated core domain-containing protein [Ferruginibacter sp.]